MNPERLSIRLEPTVEAVAMGRAFATHILVLFGAGEDDIEAVRAVVSEIATALVETGSEIDMESVVDENEVLLSGNLASESPLPGHTGLGERFEVTEQRWSIRIQTT